MENASQVIVGGEDVPEMGETLPLKAVTKSSDCSFENIQFTLNRLPLDLDDIINGEVENTDFLAITAYEDEYIKQ